MLILVFYWHLYIKDVKKSMLKNKMFIYYIMSRFNTNSTHPLIPNAQQYMFEQQYVSIHSEDRNMLKYPNASEFEIELPQDYLNVQGARLSSGYFPFTLYTFSEAKKNMPRQHTYFLRCCLSPLLFAPFFMCPPPWSKHQGCPTTTPANRHFFMYIVVLGQGGARYS
jgi:hypothetical protein